LYLISFITCHCILSVLLHVIVSYQFYFILYFSTGAVVVVIVW